MADQLMMSIRAPSFLALGVVQILGGIPVEIGSPEVFFASMKSCRSWKIGLLVKILIHNELSCQFARVLSSAGRSQAELEIGIDRSVLMM